MPEFDWDVWSAVGHSFVQRSPHRVRCELCSATSDKAIHVADWNRKNGFEFIDDPLASGAEDRARALLSSDESG